MAKSNNFIKLDRRLIRALGLNNAVVFSHIEGIEQAINKKANTFNPIYQQLDRLIYDTGLSKATIIKCINNLVDLQLLHKIPHTEKNKTKYKINKKNYLKLMDITDSIDNKNIKKNSFNAKKVKQDVSILYNEYLKNDTTNSDNFDTTNKDLLDKEKSKKRLSSKTSFNKDALPVHYTKANEDVLYYYIPYLFKDSVEINTIYETLRYISNKRAIDTLEYFLSKYYKRYNQHHQSTTTQNIKGILDNIVNAYNMLDYLDYEFMQDIIDEYFTTKNRNLTIQLFLSKSDNGLYSWINTIAMRLG